MLNKIQFVSFLTTLVQFVLKLIITTSLYSFEMKVTAEHVTVLIKFSALVSIKNFDLCLLCDSYDNEIAKTKHLLNSIIHNYFLIINTDNSYFVSSTQLQSQQI